MNKFKGTGLNPVVAFELEFYLLDKKRNEEGKPVPALGASKTHVYGIPDLDMFGDLFNEINENCKIQDIPATTASSEFAAGQYEINLKHTGDLLKAADDAATKTATEDAAATKKAAEDATLQAESKQETQENKDEAKTSEAIPPGQQAGK